MFLTELQKFSIGQNRANADWFGEGAFSNPYPVGSDEHRGYETAKNHIEYEEMRMDFLRGKLGV